MFYSDSSSTGGHINTTFVSRSSTENWRRVLAPARLALPQHGGSQCWGLSPFLGRANNSAPGHLPHPCPPLFPNCGWRPPGTRDSSQPTLSQLLLSEG